MTSDTLEAPVEAEQEIEAAEDSKKIEDEAEAIRRKAEQEWIEDIKELEHDCEMAEYAAEVAASQAKSAKKLWEAKVDALRQCIRNGPKVAPTHVQPALPGIDEQDEAWKDVPIQEVLTLTPKQLEKLNGSGINDVGDFEYCRSGQDRDYPDGLKSITGVGEATADKWENEVLAWIAKQTPIESIAGKLESESDD